MLDRYIFRARQHQAKRISARFTGRYPLSSTIIWRILIIWSSDKRCETEIVAFDRSHSALFEASRSDRGPIAYVGGLVESIKCQVVDGGYSVSNTNGHISTKSQHKCPGDSCSSNEECYLPTEQRTCSSSRCQRTWLALSKKAWIGWFGLVYG